MHTDQAGEPIPGALKLNLADKVTGSIPLYTAPADNTVRPLPH